MRLNPDAGFIYFLVLGRAYLVQDDIEQATINLKEALTRNAADLPWLERVRLGQLALDIAKRDLCGAGISVRQSDVQNLFADDMSLNHASTLVQCMWRICRDALTKVQWR